MSDSDRKKEQQEYKIFQSACDCCLNNNHNNINTRTISIMKYLNGKSIFRKKNDRPDIINICQKKGTLFTVGIEIFSVDHNSIKKRGKYRSKSRETKAKLSDIYEQGHHQLIETGDISNELREEFIRNTIELAKGNLNCEYSMFIETFRYHFENHAENSQQYRDNLTAISENGNIELAFLIDIETYFHDIFLNDGDTVVQVDSGLMPMFSEVVSIINSNANKKLIDYIVFYLHNPQGSKFKVIAVRTGNLKKNLSNQNVIIYDYLGEQTVKIEECTANHSSENNFDLDFRFTECSDLDIQRCVLPLYEKALKYKKNRKPFVTSRMVQHLLYIYPYAKTIEEAHKLSDEFIKKYPVKEIKDDQI